MNPAVRAHLINPVVHALPQNGGGGGGGDAFRAKPVVGGESHAIGGMLNAIGGMPNVGGGMPNVGVGGMPNVATSPTPTFSTPPLHPPPRSMSQPEPLTQEATVSTSHVPLSRTIRSSTSKPSTGARPSTASALLQQTVDSTRQFKEYAQRQQWQQFIETTKQHAKVSSMWGGIACVVTLMVLLLLRPSFIYTQDTEISPPHLSMYRISVLTICVGIIAVGGVWWNVAKKS